MHVRPFFDETVLDGGQTAADALDPVECVHRRMLLVVRMKVRSMMGRSNLDEHADDDPLKTTELGHDDRPVLHEPSSTQFLQWPNTARGAEIATSQAQNNERDRTSCSKHAAIARINRAAHASRHALAAPVLH